MAMSIPLAIYASIPQNHPNKPLWEKTLGAIPVKYEKPNPKWPNLTWKHNPLEDYKPIDYAEEPDYLWAHPIVKQPTKGENYSFIRKWFVGKSDSAFDGRTFPPKDLVFVISHAADDLYSMGFFVGGVQNGELLNPVGANGMTKNALNNVKTFVFHVNLTASEPGVELDLVSEVTNCPQPTEIPDKNPAMFTWVMQVFDYDNL